MERSGPDVTNGPLVSPVRTALHLDLDNVFSGLMKLDPTVALRFVREPKVWLDRLSTRLTNDGERRWLVLSCYLNTTADQIGTALVDNVVDRGRHADLELSAGDVIVIREWFRAAS